MAPAVSAALGAFGPLLGKLTALLADEYGHLKGVRREIRSLRSELTSMHGALKKYTKLEDPDDQVKEWMSLVRELAYDTEDCFDKYIHQLGDGGHGSGFKEFFRKTTRRLKTLGARRGIASQIADLKVRIKEVKELRTSYKLDDIACSTSGHTSVDPRLSALFGEEAHLVGTDSPRDDLAKWMLDEENKHHRRVLSIVGFGGLGKTTLANEVYHKIQGHFQCHAFVSVSLKPDTRKIIKDVISQVSCKEDFTKDIDSWDEKKSIAKLRELLQNKRYLVVVDDIWSILAWNAIKCAFPLNNLSSRIIATTRIFEVASSCCASPDDQIYEMTPLSNPHSEELFFKRIFGSEDCCPGMLKEVSNEVLKKCGGLPLAIISMSGLLANKPRVKEEWEKVKRSIGSDLNKSQSLEGMKNILSLSYNDLPPNLKTCLLYLSNFPEDYVIERERLVRRWIAEGFISEERGRSCQDVAENYFYELINKSMVQPVDISYDGKARACRVHDMMLELIISKSNEENFITVVSGNQTVWEKSQCFIRRLSIQHIDQQLASVLAKKDLSHVRSLTVTSSSCIKYLPSLVEFEALRVLDFQGCDGLEEYDMNSMDKLFQLKYLNFKGTGISELPSGVMMLHDLETLDLRNITMKYLPAGIVQLVKLQHLLTGFREETVIPIGIGNLSNLREFSGFNITESSVGAVEELGNLINLNVLRVRFIRNIEESHKYPRHAEMLVSSLCNLGRHKLQSFYIGDGNSTLSELLDSWRPLPSCLQRFHMIAKYSSKLPKWIAPALTGLACLDISLSEVTEEYLRILGELPALLSLTLRTNKVQEDRIPLRGRGFQCLKEFVFKPFREGAGTFLFEEGALPKVEKLELLFFVSMAKPFGFYLGIEHLRCLKVAEVILHKRGATSLECKAAAASIWNEANLHPNHPKLTRFAEEAHLVGLDKPRDNLAKWILEEENKHHRRVLSIFGFGGLGKTTLANEVYGKIQGHFHCDAFVSVSQNDHHHTKSIIKDVISQVPSKHEFTKDMESWDEKKSIAKLRKLLQDKRYLVIIDGIRSILLWNAIKCAFPENNLSSRIIATTCIFEVATSCCPSPDDQIYEMTPLSNPHSEELFFRRSFGSDCCPDMFKEVANDILKKCAGLPLEIISISGLLANRPCVKEEWEMVRRSVGSVLNASQSLVEMKNVLSLSYNNLSPNLKTCLMFLFYFPEDYVFWRKKLVRLWINVGFISEEGGQEVAEDYFYELINKCMLQPVDIDFDDGMVRACRVHDVLVDLAISGSIEHEFITVVNT